MFEKSIFLGCCTPIKCAIGSNKRQSNRAILLLMFFCEEGDGRLEGGSGGGVGLDGGEGGVKHMANERGWKKWCFHYVDDL